MNEIMVQFDIKLILPCISITRMINLNYNEITVLQHVYEVYMYSVRLNRINCDDFIHYMYM